jgi:ferric-dicitrate binding protein FerR (iron transport regulator)
MNMPDIDRDRQDLLATLIRRAGPRSQPSAALENQVRSAVYEEWQRTVKRHRQHKATRWLAAAAIGAIALTLGWRAVVTTPVAAPIATIAASEGQVHVNDTMIADPSGLQVHEQDRIETSTGGGLRLAIKGTASVRLSSATQVRWLGSQQVELEQGSIYVDSGRDHFPLTIKTRFGIIRHLGTRYQVHVGESAVQIQVRDGQVDLSGAQGVTRIGSGESLRVDNDGQLLRQAIARFGTPWIWADSLAPHFQMDNRSLADFLRWAADESGHSLRYQDAETERAAARTILHGSTTSLSPTEAIDAILPTTDFIGRPEGDDLVIVRR